MANGEPPPADQVSGKLEKLRREAYLDKRGIDPHQPFQLDLLLPDLNNSQRFIPNDYARSSLFTARNKKEPRRLLQHEKLFHLHEGQGISVVYIKWPPKATRETPRNREFSGVIVLSIDRLRRNSWRARTYAITNALVPARGIVPLPL